MKMNLICDVDGILTTGEHFYSRSGKEFKSFGSNDKDCLVFLMNFFDKIILCSADSTGQDINTSRVSEFGNNITYMACSTRDRQNLIDEISPCLYLGDGILEPKATVNMCLLDSTPQAKNNADFVLQTTAGKNVFSHLLFWLENNNVFFFAKEIKKVLKNNKIILCGVGKNFSLAQLVCEFFLPYNIIAVPLDANHSLHGSLGIINENDILISSSKSGNTIELVDMMIALNKKIPNFNNSFLITSVSNSILSNYFKNTYVCCEDIIEGSKFNFSPQNTIIQYLKIYFIILNIINNDISISKEDYLSNHQGGSIGKNK
jgi:D-arabinose 5-phosphate isomerase GutQ